MMYQPPVDILKNYAKVLVNFALNGGQGIRPGEVVVLQVPESAKPLLIELYKIVLQSGAFPIVHYLPDEMERMFFENATEDQLNFFPKYLLQGRLRQADHFLTIIAETNKHELEGIDPRKIMQRSLSFKPYLDWRTRKENQGRMTWTLGLYPTTAMAAEAKITLKQAWQQVIKACYLNDPDPVATWNSKQQFIFKVRRQLNALPIKTLHITAPDTDLFIGIDHNRRWLGGDGRNIPSFEVFISPDWRATTGHIRFDLPLYRYGNVIRDIFLEFRNGIVTKSTASQGESVLKHMIATDGADKIGEFSLTDRRLSKINRFMAETLYDENYGGKYGNTHVALGMAYKESYPGNLKKVTEQQWTDMGYNDSVVHTDIISSTNRTVEAILTDNSVKPIYADGQFLL